MSLDDVSLVPSEYKYTKHAFYNQAEVSLQF